MDKLRVVFSIAMNNLKKWLVNPRIYLIFILTSLILNSQIAPINTFCTNSGYKITPYMFPFIMSNQSTVLLFMLGIVLLFCDAPFIEIEHPYIIMRAGRKLWNLAQLVYIAIASAIYFIFIIIVSVILVLPNLEMSLEWGKVIGTFSQMEVALEHSITIPFDFSIFNSYTPISSMLLTFLNCCLVSIFLGLLIFLLNLNLSRSAGTIAATVLVLWQLVVSKTWTGYTKYSPVTWVSLSKIDTNGSTLFPTLGYTHIVIIALIILFFAISVFSLRKKDINVLKMV